MSLLKILLGIGLVFSTVSCVYASPYQVPSHPSTIYASCLNLPGYVDATLIGVQAKAEMSSTVLVGWDRNHDGQVDLIEFYEFYGVGNPQLKPFPFKIALSDYLDEKIDHVYMDFNGNGVCADIRDVGTVVPQMVKAY